MRSYSHLSEDEETRCSVPGRGAVDGGDCPGVGRAKPPSPGSCSGTHSALGGYSTASRRRRDRIAQRGVKRSSNERPLYVCSWGTGLAEGWTPEQILRLVEIRGTNRGCGPSAARQSTPSSIGPHRRPRPCGVI